MNKIQFIRPWLIIILLILFLLSEIGWMVYLYNVEKQDFEININSAIYLSTEELAHASAKTNPIRYSTLVSNQGAILSLLYIIDSDTIDIRGKAIPVYGMELRSYDMRNEQWRLDSLDACFRQNTEYPDVDIVFVRQDETGKIIDSYPEQQRPQRLTTPAEHPAQLLGYIDAHYLKAWFNFPFHYFWQRQKYGLLISLLPLLLVIYYGLLILKKMQIAQRALRLIDKQTIFIHDLKTPLCTNRDIETRILQNADQWPPEKIQEKLKITCRQSEKILDDLREATIFSAGHWGGEIQNQTFNLQKTLEELIAFRQEGLENADISLDFRLDNPVICADPFHFVHIVDNLISNAAKYADGKIIIRITCQLTEQHELSISVKDNGPGIPDHIQKHIFKKGFRHKSENKYSQGLGLAYIRNIIRQYAGRIEVQSGEGEGTEFSMVFQPEKFRQQSQKNISNRVYPCIFISLLLAELLWFANLYTAERSAFLHREGKIIDRATFKISNQFFEWQDTACFRNNWAEKTITITRGRRDTTVSMGNRSQNMYIHGRLSYDLRDSYWPIDSVLAYYQGASKNTLPVSMIRTTSTGKIIDATPSPPPDIFMPVHFDMPLGYVEGHHLYAQLAFPWQQPFLSHSGWLLLSLALTLLCGWFTCLLATLTRRQKAFIRFQHKEVQFLIRKLQQPLITQLHTEKNMYLRTKQHIMEIIPGNLETYRQTLIIINHLLDRLTMIKIHPLILTESYGN